MLKLTETPRPRNVGVITGHFQEGPAYRTVRPHGTDDFLLMLTLSGQGRVGTADGALLCATGDVTVLRAAARHDYGTDSSIGHWEFIWAHFLPRPHQLAWLNAWPEHSAGLIHLSLIEEAPEIFEKVRLAAIEMHRRAMSGMNRRDDFALNSLEELLLWSDAAVSARSDARVDPRVSQAMEYMQENLGEAIALEDLSRRIGLSMSRFGHLFREQVGQTPQFFLETQRIERAQHLLTLSGKSIASIAATVGYENPFYFTLRFKKRTGLSPSDWRLRQRAQPADPVGGDDK